MESERTRGDERAAAEAEAERADHKLADSVEEMEERTEQLHEHVDELRKDWQAKREDRGVPGAEPPDEADRA
jgi:ribosomal protein S15P/S13E